MMMWGLILVIVLLIPLAAVILDSQVGRALASRLERSTSELPPAEAERLRALEAEVERLSDELARLSEQGEFLQRLVAERPKQGLPPGNAGGA